MFYFLGFCLSMAVSYKTYCFVMEQSFKMLKMNAELGQLEYKIGRIDMCLESFKKML